MEGIALEALTMEAAALFWQQKVKLGPGEFTKLADEAKLRAFAVSGIAQGDELDTVFNALQQAIESGISYNDFKEQCADIFERRGWTGQRSWRVDNIFRTNIQTAYNVGRYQQLQEVVDTFPYWQYLAVNDRRTRYSHRALDGKVFPANHPFWDTWYPPNGFRCRCTVRALTASQVERMGLRVESDDPTNTMIMPDETQGQTTMVNPVQLLPDPGFAYHPGKVFWANS